MDNRRELRGGPADSRRRPAFEALEPRVLLDAAPVLDTPLDPIEVDQDAPATVVDLWEHVDDPDYDGVIYEFACNVGTWNVLLYEDQTPITVANFRAYADAGDYDNSFIHRSAPGFVVQGGGFTVDGHTVLEVPSRGAILNEPGISNVRATIAMAKMDGDPNSATSEWFFNLADNSANLDFQNGGFTVFGEALDMTVVDNIAALPIVNLLGPPLDTVPLADWSGGDPVEPENLVSFSSIHRAGFTFSVIGNTAPDLVTTGIDDGVLTLTYAPGAWGEAEVTVHVEDVDGETLDVAIPVTVNRVGGATMGDFDGDGKADLLWRHESGGSLIWFMDGGAVGSEAPVTPVPDPDWAIAGVGDFDGDGKSDILWRHRSGQNHLWFMDGASIVSEAAPPPVADAAWDVAGVGDFDGDGKADILWRHTSGADYLWTMDGASIASEGALPTVDDTNWQVGGVGDFDGDGLADVLWRHSSGANVLWWMDGAGGIDSSSNLPTVDADWDVGSVGDFDGDGLADIFWRHSEGANHLWFMGGATPVGDTALSSVPADWHLPGWRAPQAPADPVGGIQGDFDGDGHGDLLWRHSSGANHLWFMEGGTIREGVDLPWVGDTDWSIVGVGDFNADGKSDILWRHGVVGQNHIWFMDGGTISSSGDAPMVNDLNWGVGGVGDFNGDGKADILWRHSTGLSILWFMDGTSISSQVETVAVTDAEWQVAGVGDFDGNGKADILWRHSSGYNHMWFMDGATIVSEAAPPAVGDTGWQVGAVGDFDGDGKADILWRHAIGLNHVWFMDGTSILSAADLPAVPTDWDVI